MNEDTDVQLMTPRQNEADDTNKIAALDNANNNFSDRNGNTSNASLINNYGLSRPPLRRPSPSTVAAVNDRPFKGPSPEESTEVATEDEQTDEDWSKLRCTSVCTEVLSEQEKSKQQRRQNRCADYPGLAFGSAMFGSDTMMKFNIIKNELHNIMRSQLKRVDGEVLALSQRIKALDDNLEKSEQYIKSATQALSEAVAIEVENKGTKQGDGNDDYALSQFDAQMTLLEGRMRHAKLLAEEVNQNIKFPESRSDDT